MSKFQKIKPVDTTIDPRFQRELDEKRARAIAQNFRTDLIGVPVLSRRPDGALIRIDGQHRLAAAVMADFGNEPMLMEIHEGLSLVQEAELFLRLNGGRSAVRVFDKFKARQVAEEPIALDIVAILKKQHLKITKAQQKRGVCAIQAVEAVYHKGNLEPTMQVLTMWGEGDPAAYESPLIKAVSSFLCEWPQVDLVEIAQRLQGHAPGRIVQKLKQVQGSFEYKPHEAACIVLRDIYNERRGKRSRLPPPGRAALAEAAE